MVYVTVCIKNDENHLYAIFLEPRHCSFGEFYSYQLCSTVL